MQRPWKLPKKSFARLSTESSELRSKPLESTELGRSCRVLHFAKTAKATIATKATWFGRFGRYFGVVFVPGVVRNSTAGSPAADLGAQAAMQSLSAGLMSHHALEWSGSV